ncbi:MAG TPA: AbrB/MazE/SpoVT family DNA-binding domain-containing protein [Candidatus Norongarragalinales archaeon]|nr:AbrB/MazE/SpoVT family DNA-binding domain-containing protein [Candidatus Norongarragalinales archaeon]
MELVTVNQHGQITLPATERKKFGIKAGSSLSIEPRKDGLFLKKATLVEDEVLEKIRRIADAKGITQKDIIRMCREVGRQIYKEEYG